MVGCNSIKCNSIEHNSIEKSNIYPKLNATLLNEVPLNDQQHLRLNEINEIKDYFVAEIISVSLLLFYQQQAVVFLSHDLQRLWEHL